MIIRSKAPLRLGLAGGGTDVSPYSDLFGGAILNATISLYAYTTIEPTDDGKITFQMPDKGISETYDTTLALPTDGQFILHKGVYNRIVKDFIHKPLSFRLSTYVDAPAGSGLGTSSTLVVSILGAFVEWFKLPLGEYDTAQLAYQIERSDLAMAGGKQDQYAATFGGFNFMEFFDKDKVIVNPLRVRQQFQDELAHNLLLFYTQTSRQSAKIIEAQAKNVIDKNQTSIEAMHHLKEQAIWMKECILKGETDKMGEILNFGWTYKKQMTQNITNPLLDEIYKTAIDAGASGGKVSGAGGGGFMSFYCPGISRYAVEAALQKFGGQAKRYEFTQEGLKTWTQN
ncbi:MAG: dehydrogenase [Sphingobacteriia bacterium]|nr:dehydrogenase [Paludibacteraceae bacterium]NCA78848.1 dehydrogenase [Sphingobacteriia bacterium]